VASYRVFIKPSAAKELVAGDPKKDRQRIVAGIRALAEDPRPPGCEKLVGADDRYRIRVGRSRVIYSVEDEDKEFVLSLTRAVSEQGRVSSQGPGLPF